MTALRLLILSSALPLLAACVAGSAANDRRNALAAEYNGLVGYRALPAVTDAQLINTGTASYDGVMVVRVDTFLAETEILGDATVEVNFVTDAVTGTFGGFVGRTTAYSVGEWTETIPVTAVGSLSGANVQTLLNGRIDSPYGSFVQFNNLALNGRFHDDLPTSLEAPDGLSLQVSTGSIIFNNNPYTAEPTSTCDTCVLVVAED